MVSLSIMGMTGWVNPSWLLGALGPSLSRGGGLWAPFFVENPGSLTSGGSVMWGEAHGGETPRVQLQYGTHSIKLTARPGYRNRR
jgi:hypothetical protein